MPQKDHGRRQMDHSEEVVRVPFPASDDAAVIMEPGEEAFDFPATAKATQHAAILCRRPSAIDLVGRDELDAILRQ